MSIAELKCGTSVDGVFFLREVVARKTKFGRSHLSLRLSDRTGIIDARVWDASGELVKRLFPDTFVRVSGRIDHYRGSPHIRVRVVEEVDATALDLREFVHSSYRNTSELAGCLEYFLTEVYDKDFSRLLHSFFGEADFLGRFLAAPGDVSSHHAYMGGLAEHTVSVATLCQHTCVQYPRLNADLLVTAALLHDVGKVEELTYCGRIGYSREGNLVGHVLLGERMLEEKIKTLNGFPHEKRLLLMHVIISHHGELEWGAPKRPQSAEALALHHIDNLDAKVKGFLEVVEGRGRVRWPQLQNYFRRPLDEPLAADKEY